MRPPGIRNDIRFSVVLIPGRNDEAAIATEALGQVLGEGMREGHEGIPAFAHSTSR